MQVAASQYNKIATKLILFQFFTNHEETLAAAYLTYYEKSLCANGITLTKPRDSFTKTF